MHILIVDDHALVAKAIRDVLERDGHRVAIALGGMEGVKAFHTAQARNDAFGVVFTDFRMTDLDGLEVAAAVKQASRSTPVILMTAYGVLGDEPPPHVDLVLAKPPGIQELRAALARPPLEE